jgi:hypothetical protein
MKKHHRFIIVLLLASLPLFLSFYSMNNTYGTHYEMVVDALVDVHQAPFAIAVKNDKTFLVGWNEYKYEQYFTANLMAEAARDADQFFFGDIYAHSQTPPYDVKKTMARADLLKIERDALWNYFQYTKRIRRKIMDQFEKKDAYTATYMLGFYLHTFEDLYSHQGITNEQHLWLNEKYRSPDYLNEHIALCRKGLRSFLAALPGMVGEDNHRLFMDALHSAASVPIPTDEMSAKLLRHGKDILIEGIKYELMTSYTDDCMRYFRQVSWDIFSLERLLLDGSAAIRLLSLESIEDMDRLLASFDYDYDRSYIAPGLKGPAAGR